MDSPCNLCIRVVLPGLLYCFSIFAVSIFFVVPESCVTCLAFVLFFDSSTSLKNALDLFGVEFNRIEDTFVQLDKLLQVVLAFKTDGYNAFTKKSQILKVDSNVYLELLNYIPNGCLTTFDYINMYLLFLRAEKEKKESDDKRTPIPYYLLGFLGRDLKGLEGGQIRVCFRAIFKSKENLDAIYNYYKRVTKMYTMKMRDDKNIEESIIVREREIQYCVGIKRPRDYAYKRYLFTPSKELGDEDIFFLNKNMEFLRLQESKGIIPNLTYIYGR